jgi:crotonobetainyl-CoA:carnitine CoA-transferase CaiB-like acyl-CoA transferase
MAGPGAALMASAPAGRGRLGEHTDEVLAELGYGADQVAIMRASRVVA